MAGPDRNGRNATDAPADGDGGDLQKRMRDLDARLASHRRAGAEGDERSSQSRSSEMGKAIRLSSEFIAGIIVGAVLGWVIDSLAGTSPLGLIVFLFLGFGAGILNVLRAAGTVAEFGVQPRDKDGNSGGSGSSSS